jgi:hypothetical protein
MTTVVRAFREEEAPSSSKTMKDNRAKELVNNLNNGASDVASKVQAWWEASDEKPTIIAVGAGSLLALYFASSTIDRLPLISTIFELIGLTFTGWTAYRYFLIDGEKDKMVSQVKGFASKVGIDL